MKALVMLIEGPTIWVEKIMSNETNVKIFGFIAILAPVYFLKTLYSVWFGPLEVFIGFQSEKSTWLVLTIVDAVGFLTTLPSREKGRVIQMVTCLWTIEIFLVWVATIVRQA
ncbi:MAG: hypothetical protein UY41_C0009G0018 [Candidatus Moranbacteria bacterium GW2011_GWE1_49_15]|nr:MAG: hypothetical protein UX75_C0002G0020 [Candidatus Moranbacteria bacterium GW2011_GWE2_47_10]KKW07079.1 MAG: hypothetical protein UY41_C0009G0018 [Candidatus Moranbacteria bacterium GW2011_GWE1_49_15]HBP01431.1 hypothetical protein [Candidatus Moranbacteria bacterium]